MGPGPRPGMLSYEDGVSTVWTRIITYNIKYGGTQCKKNIQCHRFVPNQYDAVQEALKQTLQCDECRSNSPTTYPHTQKTTTFLAVFL